MGNFLPLGYEQESVEGMGEWNKATSMSKGENREYAEAGEHDQSTAVLRAGRRSPRTLPFKQGNPQLTPYCKAFKWLGVEVLTPDGARKLKPFLEPKSDYPRTG